MKVAIVTTHPIQYQVPWIRLLAREPGIELVVLYAMIPDAAQQGGGFGVALQWDVPLLDGYRHRVLTNVAVRPSVTERNGCDTPGIGNVLRAERVDVVIVNGWVVKTCLQALAACRRLGIPCIVRGESNLLRPRALWKRLLHRLHLRRYSAFLSIGSSNRAFYLAHGVPAARIFDTPYGVDNDFFATRAAAARPRRTELRAGWGVPPEAVVVLFAGKFEAKKRPADIVAAARCLATRPSGRRLHFLMVGSGELQEPCRAAVRAEKLPVSFAGFFNQGAMPGAYSAADALILPSDHGETWGLVVNEAMACGLPVCVSDQVGCGPDLVTDGVTGFVYRCGDVEGLVAKLDLLAESPQRRKQMGGAALGRVAAHSLERVVAGAMEAVNSVAASPGGKRC